MEKIYIQELELFTRLKIPKFLSIYDRNEIDFFMEDVKEFIQEGREFIQDRRMKKLDG